MGIGSLFESRSVSVKNAPEWLINAFGGGVTKSGVTVNENIALGLTAVWACVNKISSTMGLFPLPIYQSTSEYGKTRATAHPQYRLIHDAPNPEMTSYEWRQMMMTYELLWGAGISEIEFDGNGKPIALWPIETWRVRPDRTAKKTLVYRVSDSNGKTRSLYPRQLLIFRYVPEINGGWKSPIQVHRETIGSAIAAKEFGARTFGQGVNPAGVVSGVARAINADGLKTLRERFAGYEGLGNAHRLMILEQGEKFERIGLPPQDAQYLETRQFDICEIARIYDVPPVLIHELTKTTSWGSGIEQLKDGFISLTMAPHCARWEQEINAKLVSVDDPSYYCKFVMDGLLRGNLRDRTIAYVQQVNNGILSRNEVREMEDRNPIADGDKIFVPMNMQTLDKAVNGDDMEDNDVEEEQE